jgi:two-component system, NarL family, invasion response regulator UvrY
MTENAKIRIMIVDDHDMVRKTWKLVLEQHDAYKVIVECDNGEDAIEMAYAHQPDVILMDINMQPMNGFEATRKIIENTPHLKIIGISVNNQPAYARNILKLGGKGYVTKNSSPKEMFEAINSVTNGKNYICTEIQEQMNQESEDQRKRADERFS